jgi:hypothetical protein
MGSCLDNSGFFGLLKKGFLRDYPPSGKQKSNRMKFQQLLLGVLILISGCSSPKYAYHFDTYDYNSGKKGSQSVEKSDVEHSPLVINTETLVATTEHVAIATEEKKPVTTPSVREVREQYKAMTKNERREFRKALMSEVKKQTFKRPAAKEGVDSIKATKQFDTLSALAIIFGGAGIVLIMFANISNVFWVVGAISLIVGAFFFVKWVANGNG